MSTLRRLASTLCKAMCQAIIPLAIASCGGGATSTVESRGDAPGASSAAVELKVGDPAPPLDLPGSDGKRYRLADYKGRQVVVLAWFAKAFSSS